MTRANAAIGLVLVGLLLAIWHLGYIGGPLFDVRFAKHTAMSSKPRAVALYLSGDMGFHAGLGPKIAGGLSENGVPVVGENSLFFFRTRRTPEETGAMIAQGLRRAMAVAPGAQLILIGQSFGADVVAPSLPYVPLALRRHIALVALIVPGATRQWRASPSEIFSFNEPEENAATAGRKLSWAPLLCIYGKEEETSLCPALSQANAVRLMLPGAHSLNHDPKPVRNALLHAIDRVLQRRNGKA
jgi:type IV secretory pathway VirJ component